jgi:Terminase large subunit, T4likevirus-type, N-terminal
MQAWKPPSIAKLEKQYAHLVPDLMPDIAWVPFPNSPQQILYRSYKNRIDEILFGGSCGGGKTDGLLGIALKKHKRAVIFRREATQIENLVTRSTEILDASGLPTKYYNGTSHIWKLPDRHVLKFAGVPHEKDIAKHKGVPWDLIAFDELTEFSENMYKTLTIWNRTEDPNIFCQVISTCNPPMPDIDSDHRDGGQWIIRHWAPWLDGKHRKPAKSGEVRYFAALEKETEVPDKSPILFKGETITPKSRVFIKATVDDNPVYLKSGYKDKLLTLSTELKEIYLYGNFLVSAVKKPFQVLDPTWVQACMDRSIYRQYLNLDSLGLDPARGGGDNAVLSPRYGSDFADLIVIPGVSVPDGSSLATHVIQYLLEHPGYDPWINIEINGIGSSPYDILANQEGLNVAEINVSRGVKNADGKPLKNVTGHFTFVNLRAYLWWNFREAIDPSSPNYDPEISLPDDPLLMEELCAPRYKIQLGGIQIEDKDRIKVRLGRSPDRAEALLIAYYRSKEQKIAESLEDSLA